MTLGRRSDWRCSVTLLITHAQGETTVGLTQDFDGTASDNRKCKEGRPIPGGVRPGDLAMLAFHMMAAEPGVANAFLTGRNIRELHDAIEAYSFQDLRLPFAAVDTGLHMYQRDGGVLKFDHSFNGTVREQVQAFGWDKVWMTGLLRAYSIDTVWLTDDAETRDADSLKVQWTVKDPARIDEFTDLVSRAVKDRCHQAAVVIGSVDKAKDRGFLDVMPLYRFENPGQPEIDPGVTGKVIGMEYLRRRLGLPRDRMVYAGDSMNDYTALVEGYCGTIVENASPEVKDRILAAAVARGTAAKLFLANGPWRQFPDSVCLRGVVRGAMHHGLFRPDLIFEAEKAILSA